MLGLIAEAQHLGIELRADPERGAVRYRPKGIMPQDLAQRIQADKERVLAALTVFDLARVYYYGVAVVIGGGIDQDNDHALILGEVVGGDQAHWQLFVDRASTAQLAEAAHLLKSLAEAA
jgi:hypothetical protein